MTAVGSRPTSITYRSPVQRPARGSALLRMPHRRPEGHRWGALIVGPGHGDPIPFQAGNPYGTSRVCGNGTTLPGDVDLAAVSFHPIRAVPVAEAFVTGRASIS